MPSNGDVLGKVTTIGPRGEPYTFDLLVGDNASGIGVRGSHAGLLDFDQDIRFVRVSFNQDGLQTTVGINQFNHIKLGKPHPPQGRIEFVGLNHQVVTIEPADE